MRYADHIDRASRYAALTLTAPLPDPAIRALIRVLHDDLAAILAEATGRALSATPASQSTAAPALTERRTEASARGMLIQLQTYPGWPRPLIIQNRRRSGGRVVPRTPPRHSTIPSAHGRDWWPRRSSPARRWTTQRTCPVLNAARSSATSQFSPKPSRAQPRTSPRARTYPEATRSVRMSWSWSRPPAGCRGRPESIQVTPGPDLAAGKDRRTVRTVGGVAAVPGAVQNLTRLTAHRPYVDVHALLDNDRGHPTPPALWMR